LQLNIRLKVRGMGYRWSKEWRDRIQASRWFRWWKRNKWRSWLGMQYK
jgi:hypothetical protein